MRPLHYLTTTVSPPSPGRATTARPRRGRVLVECCVAMVLLAGAGALTLLVTANTAHLVDESRQRDRAQRVGANHLARALSGPCLVDDGATREAAGPRVLLDVVSGSSRGVHVITVDAWWQSSGLADHAWHHQATTVSGWCE